MERSSIMVPLSSIQDGGQIWNEFDPGWWLEGSRVVKNEGVTDKS